MPTYAYACTECDHRFDIVQSFSDDSLTVCPECGGKLRKVFNAVGVVFKGSGFYRTDSRSDSRTGSTVPAGSSKDGKDGKASESKGSEAKVSAGKSSSKDGAGSSTASTSGSSSSSSSSGSGSAA